MGCFAHLHYCWSGWCWNRVNSEVPGQLQTAPVLPRHAALREEIGGVEEEFKHW